MRIGSANIAAASALFLVIAAQPGRGQATVALGLGAAPDRPLSLRPGLTFGTLRVAGTLDGAWDLSAHTPQERWGRANVEILPVRYRTMALALSIEGATHDAPGETRLALTAAHSGVGISSAGARLRLRAGGGWAWQEDGPRPVSLVGLTGALRRGPFRVDVTWTEVRAAGATRAAIVRPQSIDSVPPLPPETTWVRQDDRTWREMAARLGWTRRWLHVEVAAGTRLHQGFARSSRWMLSEVSAQLGPELAIVGRVGRQPSPVLGGAPSTHAVTLGLRVAPALPRRAATSGAARAFEIHRVHGAEHRLQLIAPGARQVELTGDFTGWQVVSLRPQHAGVWAITLAVPPGTYHVNIRIDGGPWRVPPGLRAVPDDFAGAVGVLRIE